MVSCPVVYALPGKESFLPFSFVLTKIQIAFNTSTIISVQSTSQHVPQFVLTDVLGNEVAALVNEDKPAGSYKAEFSATGGASRPSSGVYFYQLESGSNISTKKTNIT